MILTHTLTHPIVLNGVRHFDVILHCQANFKLIDVYVGLIDVTELVSEYDISKIYERFQSEQTMNLTMFHNSQSAAVLN